MPENTKQETLFRSFLKEVSFDKTKTWLTENIFFFFWIFLVPLIMLGMKQGHEMLIGLFDDTGAYPAFRASSMLAVYFVQALSIWLLPKAIFCPRKSVKEIAELRPLTTRNLYLGTLVSILPMILYGAVMITVQYMRNRNIWLVLLSLVITAASAWATHWVIKKGAFKIKILLLVALANLALVFLLVLFGKGLQKQNLYWNYAFVGVCMVIQVPILAGLFKRLLLPDNGRVYNWFYWSVVALALGTVGLMSVAENLHFQSPPFILLCITTLYILINDLVVAMYKLLSGKWLKYGLTFLLLAFGYFQLIHKTRIHDVSLVDNNGLAAADRVDFSTYFKAWYLNNIAPDINPAATDTIPMYMAAVQGGGSRAGLWSGMIINELAARDDHFQKRLFAITSASGGSVGMGATLSAWRYLQDNPGITPTRRDTMLRAFSTEMFRGNFLSVSFMQIFVNEVGKRFLTLGKGEVHGRNYELQNHEAVSFARGLREGWSPEKEDDGWQERLKQMFRKGDKNTLYMCKNAPNIPNYPYMPYLSYWYSAPKTPDTRLPLYFPITTNIQTGKSGFCSPIAWDSTLFIDAIDMLSACEKGRPGKSIAMVTATHFSQLFPVMSAYTYVPETGNFLDGGLFENMGLTLQASLCHRIEQEVEKADYIPDAVKKRLKIRMLFVVNSALEPDKDEESGRMNQNSATLSALGFSSIAGTSTWWMQHLKNIKPGGQMPIEFILQTPLTSDNDRLPLGRWLSNRSIEYAVMKKDAQEAQFQETLGN